MLKKMTVGMRLLLNFVTIAAFGAIVAGIGIYRMAQMNEQAELAYKLDLMGISHIKDTNIELAYIGRELRGVLLARDDAGRNKMRGLLEMRRKNMHGALAKARPLFTTDEGKAMLASLDKALAEYEGAVDATLQKAAPDTPEAREEAVAHVFTAIAPKVAVVDGILEKLGDLKENSSAEYAQLSSDSYQSSRNLMIGLVLASLGAGALMGGLLARALGRDLGGEPFYARRVAGDIAAGNLGADIVLRQGDDRSVLAAMKGMRDSLTAIVREVRTASDTISTASAEIASGNMDLSSRTEEQASSLEETASSMEELTGTVRQNAENAERANQLAQSAAQVAVRGGAVVERVMQTMASINESSGRIEAIIGVIDGIAFQTNILALNAAVEAARAGEQGRGFAVVATEVRSLAQRAAAAAREIKGLIDDSVEKVGEGGKLVDQAGQTMEEIVRSIERVTGIMGEIADASREQTLGIDQINQAIAQMDETTQQNAALVEQAAAAAGAMQEQAAALAQAVSVFNLDGGRHAGRPTLVASNPSGTALAEAPQGRMARRLMACDG
jgi:methyl-accepting chemotaxis protein